MKIHKGYTLSQFIDKVNEDTKGIYVNTKSWGFDMVVGFNALIKNVITKSMFINKLEHKWTEIGDKKVIIRDSHEDKWEIEEKKIIFNLHPTEFYFDTEETVIIKGKTFYLNKTTISEVFEAFNGELRTKNIEI